MTSHDIDGLQHKTVAAPYFGGLLSYLKSRQQDPSVFLARFDIDATRLEDIHTRLPATLFLELLQAGSELLDDDDIGLHVGEQIKPGHYGVLGFSIMNCESLKAAIEHHVRYQNLVSSLGTARYEVGPDAVSLTWDTGTPPVPRQIAEQTVASWVTFVRWLIERPLSPSQVAFQHPAPKSTIEHQKLFQCPVLFSRPMISIDFPTSYLDLPIRQHDPVMLAMLDKYAERLLITLDESTDIVNQTRATIAARIIGEGATLDAVASKLGYSPRNLQRKLREAGSSYQRVLDETRRSLALKQIEDPLVDLTEIAYLLDFSDQSAFQRAFKRWTGMTPGKYRKEHS